MSTHAQRCPHCRAKNGQGGPTAPPVGPIPTPEPPEVPRLFRIHYAAGHARDYTLHPDGRLTFAVNGQVLTTSLDFAFMAETSWEGAHIEWDPDPLPETSPPVEAAAPVTQELLLELPAA
jgi:hypothetical protein